MSIIALILLFLLGAVETTAMRRHGKVIFSE